MKKVLIITGSPRKNGNTNTLAEALAKGVQAAGGEVEFFDAASCEMDGCHGDQSCFERGYCGLKDDGMKMNSLMCWADVLVLVSPVYWAGMTAQIKKVIDRMYQFSAPKGRAVCTVKEMMLITAGASPDDAVYEGVIGTYQLLGKLLDFEDKGMLVAKGLGGPDEVKQHEDYIKQAIEMGYRIV